MLVNDKTEEKDKEREREREEKKACGMLLRETMRRRSIEDDRDLKKIILADCSCLPWTSFQNELLGLMSFGSPS